MYTIFSVAKWFMNKEKMNNKKLQKLCWYAYSWYIALYSEPLNENDELKNKYEKLFDTVGAEAWIHGPVFRELYIDYKYDNYRRTIEAEEIEDKEKISFLEKIWEVYGPCDGYNLEAMTHKELPWIKAREGVPEYETSDKIIDEKYVFEEYLGR